MGFTKDRKRKKGRRIASSKILAMILKSWGRNASPAAMAAPERPPLIAQFRIVATA